MNSNFYNPTPEQKVLFTDAILNSNDTISIWELVKILRRNGYRTSKNNFLAELHKRGYLMKCGTHDDMPTQQALEAGLMQIIEYTTYSCNTKIIIKCTPRITGKGQIFFVNLFLNSLRGGDE